MVIPSLLLGDHHFWSHFLRKIVTNPKAAVETKGSQHSYPFEFRMDYTVVETKFFTSLISYQVSYKVSFISKFYNLRTYDIITPWCLSMIIIT